MIVETLESELDDYVKRRHALIRTGKRPHYITGFLLYTIKVYNDDGTVDAVYAYHTRTIRGRWVIQTIRQFPNTADHYSTESFRRRDDMDPKIEVFLR